MYLDIIDDIVHTNVLNFLKDCDLFYLIVWTTDEIEEFILSDGVNYRVLIFREMLLIHSQ